ncbi:hypothetical protein [Cyclobacterium plantarum]|uniref:Lipoprotein n=1 Tax=Cyclobacterium plantarum TaxID=2716263 RepID=A0ABX0HCJ4_9BACT|nr:hypothetical protein [Cyclobacterium plantarum]NHE58643.1 hypothetical protein [Cyclobacterium plantarum]
MKNLFVLLIVSIVAASCSKKSQDTSQKFIEPSEYHLMGYQVKDITYHDSVKYLLANEPYIRVLGDSTFTVSEELGQLLFKGRKFTYKVFEDSLILSNKRQRLSFKMQDLSPNSFTLEVHNKFLKRIDMVKPKEMRRKVIETVTIEY